MKNLFVGVLILMATVIYSSCASSKKAESAKAKTEVQKGNLSRFEELKSQATNKLRGIGEGRSFDMNMALRVASTNASMDIAKQIKNATTNAKKHVLTSYQLNENSNVFTSINSTIPEAIIIDRAFMTDKKLCMAILCIELVSTVDELKITLSKEVVEELYKNHPELPIEDKDKITKMVEENISFANTKQ